jgi:hypothetical protein
MRPGIVLVIAGVLRTFAGTRGYDLHQQRHDRNRFTFLLDADDGQALIDLEP